MTSFKLKIVLMLSVIASTCALLFVNGEEYTALYLGLRAFGHIAVPLACFLMVEGFTNTSNRKMYGIRLFACGLAAEVPYLLVNNRALAIAEAAVKKYVGADAEFSYDNLKPLSEAVGDDKFVYYFDIVKTCGSYLVTGLLTLACAYLMVWLLDICRERFIENNKAAFVMGSVGVMVAFTFFLIFVPFESSLEIILFSSMFYFMSGNKPFIAIMSTLMIFCFYTGISVVYSMGIVVAIILVYAYNDEPGNKKLQYMFYAAFPLQYLVSFLIYDFIVK